MMRRSQRLLAAIAIVIAMAGCDNVSGSGNSPSTSTGAPLAANSVQVTVGPMSVCDSQNDYPNEPCTSVTVCLPGTATCQTVSDILVDTGSFGLRLFSSVLSLPNVTPTSGTGECSYFGSMTTWGPVTNLDVTIAQETTTQSIPVQLIDPTFENQYDSSGNGVSGGDVCGSGSVAATPSSQELNGILGIGQSVTDGQYYYDCSGGSCTQVYPQEVENPVAEMPVDNNGVVLSLPGIGSQGAPSVRGTLTLGIGTQSDNTPGSVTVYQAESSDSIGTTFNGTSYTGFLDSGTNDYAVPGTWSTCSGWFCPSSTQTATIGITSASGQTGSYQIQIADANTLFATNNAAFNNLGAPNSEDDLGLPFFFGRTVYVGISGRSTSIGSGPFWAF